MLDRLLRLFRDEPDLTLRDQAAGTIRQDGAVKVRSVIFDRSSEIVEAVGEGFRLDALMRVGGGRGVHGVGVPDQIAGLLPEPSNPFDAEAVMVQIDGQMVGYLSREDARAYRPIIDRLATHGFYPACHATLTGGWDRGDGDTGNIGVLLHIGSPSELWAEADAMDVET